jgi:hypothetical protein
MNMVIFAIEFNQLGSKVVAHALARLPDDFNGPLAQHPAPVFCHKDQVHMKKADNVSPPSVFCSSPVARHSKTKYFQAMQRLQAFND